MTDQTRPPDYPPAEPEGTQPRFPAEGVPADEIIGNTMGGEDDEDQPRQTPGAAASPRRPTREGESPSTRG